jgi:lipid II:glycine glycyltransferase (peptidoglycan interpeptide bridge formation enzyme)
LFDQMRQLKDFTMGVRPRFFLALPPKNLGLQVQIATKHGEDVAGLVVSLLGDTAVALFSATNDQGRATNAGYLLYWKNMLLAKEMGLSWYDLYGINPSTNPGGYQFKKAVGGFDLTAAGPFEARRTDGLSLVIGELLTMRDRLRAR